MFPGGQATRGCPAQGLLRQLKRDGWVQPGGSRVMRASRQNRKELAVDRAAKAESITELSGVFKSANVVVVAHYAGLTVAQMQLLRQQMSAAAC